MKDPVKLRNRAALIALSIVLVLSVTYEFVQSMVLLYISAAVVAALVIYWFIIWYCPYCKRALPVSMGDYCPFCGKRIHYSDNDDADSNQQQ